MTLTAPHVTATEMNELIAEISRKNSSAFGIFYDSTAGMIYSVALRILNNAADAADVAQETFVELWTRAATFDSVRGSAIAWVVSICRHKAIDRWRTRDRQTRLLDNAGFISGGGPIPPSPAYLVSAEALLVRTVVGELAPRDRRVLELAFFDGLTHREISTRLQEPVGTIKARIRRGLFKLRDMLGGLRREVS